MSDLEEASASSSGEFDEEGGGTESSEESSGSSSSEEEEEEPVLKYKRFAKEVVSSISESPDGVRNIICCIAVHPKASSNPAHGTCVLMTVRGRANNWCALFRTFVLGRTCQ